MLVLESGYSDSCVIFDSIAGKSVKVIGGDFQYLKNFILVGLIDIDGYIVKDGKLFLESNVGFNSMGDRNLAIGDSKELFDRMDFDDCEYAFWYFIQTKKSDRYSQVDKLRYSVDGITGEIELDYNKYKLYTNFYYTYNAVTAFKYNNCYYGIVDVSYMDKHYYREDREEYFTRHLVFKLNDKRATLVFDTGNDVSEYFDYIKFSNGKLVHRGKEKALI